MQYQVLSIIEAIQTRPGMYIGSTETPDHLITEILDNTLDEINNKHANFCNVYFNNNEWWVIDNGRGLNSYNLTLPDGRIKDSIEALCTESHSGSKFDNKNYKSLIGMHGVGMVVVNALSEWLVVKTRCKDNVNKILTYSFNKGSLISRTIDDDKDTWSTCIGFKVNSKFFETNIFNLQNIIERLGLCQSKLDFSNFYINNNPIPKRSFKEFVDKKLGITTFEINKSNIQIYLNFSDQTDIKEFSDVNLRFCEGTQLNQTEVLIKKIIERNIDKKFEGVSQNILLAGLRLYVSLSIPEPKFSSQEKIKMVLNVKDIIDSVEKDIENVIVKNDILDIIHKHLENKYNKKIKTTSKGKTNRVNNENTLNDSVIIPGDTLYILEGESALGSLRQCRDINTEAIFPLKGKVLNVEKSTFEKIINNKEIMFLSEAIGNKNNRRFKNIKFIADADEDGRHIVVLLTLVLMKFAEDMIKSGNVKVIIPPLFGATKGSKYVQLFKHEESVDYKNRGYDIIRYKGLGEMSPPKLEQVIRHGVEYTLKWPETDDELKILLNIISNSEYKKMLLNDERANLEAVLSCCTTIS